MKKSTKTNSFSNITKIVVYILTNKPATRDDEMLLYCHVINSYGISVKDNSFYFIACELIAKGKIPSFETISRIRRKVQEKYPSLRPSDSVKARRAEKSELFKQLKK